MEDVIRKVNFEVHWEDYYSALVPFERWEDYRERIQDNTLRLLWIFKDAGVRASFYCLGYLAEKHPDLIGRIRQDGHNIGSHGYYHRKNEQSGDFSDRTTRQFLPECVGYRSPYWSTTKMPGWSGGVFFRVLPLQILLRNIRRSGTLWIHPHDIDADQPRINVPLVFRRRYLGLKGSEAKLRRILKELA